MSNLEMLAYIDPGSGNLVLQIIIAGVIGAGMFCRNVVSQFFRFRKKSPAPVEHGTVKLALEVNKSGQDSFAH
jgi:hypothetical protein